MNNDETHEMFVAARERARAANQTRTMSIEMSMSEWHMIMGALSMASAITGNREHLGIRDVILANYEGTFDVRGN